MTLTLGHGPLSGDPAPGNYTIDGPAHRIFVEPTAKRMRVEVGGQMIADSVDVKLLHETGLLPVLYFPKRDIRAEVLQPSERRTTCPFKGEASYYSVVVGDRVEDDLVWTYPSPIDGAAAIADHVAFFLPRVDAVYEEAVRLVGHPRDPYHRVDTLRSDRHVRVVAGSEVIAETRQPMVVFETGLPARWYVPKQDVASDVLIASDTVTVCPYKGVASWWSLRAGAADVAWAYQEPLPEALGLADHVSFDGDDIRVDVAAVD